MVQRYSLRGRSEHYEDVNGDYIVYEDYQKLEAELEQLRQQVKAPSDDGWLEWGGGECPVPDNTRVQVEFLDGYAPVVAEPQYLRWQTLGVAGDIVAYRIVHN